MEREFRMTTISEQPVAYIQTKATASGISAALAQALPTVYQYVLSQGVTPKGAPYGRYTPLAGGEMGIEAGLPIPERIPEQGQVIVSTLPGGQAAEAIHVGPYEGIHGTVEALGVWMRAEGKEPSGAPWESYLTDPGTEPDPAKWRTQILWPVK